MIPVQATLLSMNPSPAGPIHKHWILSWLGKQLQLGTSCHAGPWLGNEMQQCSLRRRLCHGCVNHVELDQGRRRGCRVPVESAVPPAPSEWRGTVGPMHHLQRFYPDSWLLYPIQEGALNIVLGVAITRVLSFVRRLTISGIATFKSCLRRIPRQKRHRYLPRARTTILPSSCPGLVANMLRAAAPAAEVAADRVLRNERAGGGVARLTRQVRGRRCNFSG